MDRFNIAVPTSYSGLQIATKHGPGLIGIATAMLGRYREFDISVDKTFAPMGSLVEWSAGVNVAFHFNQFARKVMTTDIAEWLWILGDDHTWKPDLLLKLLDRNVDVVVPLCLRRQHPYGPVIHDHRYKSLGFDWLEGKDGCIDVTDELTLGNAGMLIRKPVLQKMKMPWFECGRINPETMSSDLYWCTKMRAAGVRYHLDLEHTIGHLTHSVIWPMKKNGRWTSHVCAP